jgi:single-strand DNA-binding protein
MARNETTITVVGNIVSDVTHKHTAGGISRAGFRVATTERRFNAEAGEWVDGDKLFLSVTCWRRLADGVVASLGKGDPVIVSGKLRIRDYEVDGQRRSAAEVDASAVGPDLTWCVADPRRTHSAGGIVAPRQEDGAREVVDAPF